MMVHKQKRQSSSSRRSLFVAADTAAAAVLVALVYFLNLETKEKIGAKVSPRLISY